MPRRWRCSSAVKVNVSQVLTIDKARVGEAVGAVDFSTMRQVEESATR